MPSIDTLAALSEDDYVSIFAAPPVPAELDEYLRTHRVRLLDTAARISVPDGGHVVDIGTSPPHELCTLLWLLQPTARFSAIVHPDSAIPPGDVDPVLPPRSETHVRPPIVRVQADAETDRLPFDTGTIDVAVCTEVLEHLLLNPLNLVREAARILRPGGTFVLTTPNVASLEGVARMLEGRHPFGFNTYSPYGAYGRHNREYTPAEVQLLGEAAGFTTVALTTVDTYPLTVDTSAASAVAGDAAMRGQNVVYVGRRDRYDPISTPPGLLVHDPLRHRVALSLRDGTTVDTDSLRAAVVVTNDGDRPWEVLHGVQVVASIVDANGRVVRPKVATFDIDPVPGPGVSVDVPVDLPPPEASSGAAVELDVAGIGMLGFSRLSSLASRLRIAVAQDGAVEVRRVGGVEASWPLIADFRAGRPVLAWSEGLANPEPWGTWTTGPVARIHLPIDLPTSCELTFEAQAFGPNANRPIGVAAGGASSEVAFGSEPATASACLKGVMAGTRTIELTIPEPTTPRALGIGADDRPLGLGLIRLVIDARPGKARPDGVNQLSGWR